jgi:Peroxiredoxin
MMHAADRDGDTLSLIGCRAPAFEAESSGGRIVFPEAFSGRWTVLFGHIREFTPESCADLLRIHFLEDEFRLNGCELMDLFPGDFNRFVEWLDILRERIRAQGLPECTSYCRLVDDSERRIAHAFLLPDDPDLVFGKVSPYCIVDPRSVVRNLGYLRPAHPADVLGEMLALVIALRKSERLTARAAVPGSGRVDLPRRG